MGPQGPSVSELARLSRSQGSGEVAGAAEGQHAARAAAEGLYLFSKWYKYISASSQLYPGPTVK